MRASYYQEKRQAIQYPANPLQGIDNQFEEFQDPVFQNEAGSEQKVKVVSPNKMQYAPHCAIAALTWRYPRIGKGTAFLISKNIAITAAHCIYDLVYKTQNRKIRLSAGGAYGPMSRIYQISQVFLPKQFIEDQSVAYDYAFLLLSEHMQCQEFLTLGAHFSTKEKANLLIYGYPWKRYSQNPQYQFNIYQAGFEDINTMINNQQDQRLKRYCYDIPTSTGQSGCPIILNNQEENGNLVVAIHKGYEKQTLRNCGRLITIDFVVELQIWRKRYSAEPFSRVDLETNTPIDFEKGKYKDIIDMVIKQRERLQQLQQEIVVLKNSQQLHQSKDLSVKKKMGWVPPIEEQKPLKKKTQLKPKFNTIKPPSNNKPSNNSKTAENHPRLIQNSFWNNQSPYAKRFIIDKNRLTMKTNIGELSLMMSKECLQTNETSTIQIQVHRYSDCIVLGVALADHINKIYRGELPRTGAIGIWSFSRKQEGKQKNSLVTDNRQIIEEFPTRINQRSKVTIRVMQSKKKIQFKIDNHQARDYPLYKSFLTQQFYAFACLKSDGDCIDVKIR